MLIIFLAIAVLGVTTFIIQRSAQTEVRKKRISCLNLAHAGVQQAAYFYRFRDLTANGYFTLGQTNIDSNNYFVLAALQGDLLMVNTSAAAISTRDLVGLTIQNATNSQTITIDRMVVTWNNARQLSVIRINGSNVWNGTTSSPANADITNFTLNTTPTIYPIDRLRFTGNMTGSTITIQFIMTDGSSRTVAAFPASNNNIFTVNATGKTTGSNVANTITADYNALTGKLIKYIVQ